MTVNPTNGAKLKVVLCGIKKKKCFIPSSLIVSLFTQAPDQVASEWRVPKLGSCGACAQRHAVWTLQAGMHTSPTQHTHTLSLLLLAPSITDWGNHWEGVQLDTKPATLVLSVVHKCLYFTHSLNCCTPKSRFPQSSEEMKRDF